jgi:hypothetical protein
MEVPAMILASVHYNQKPTQKQKLTKMANWGRALTTLDADSKPYLQNYDGVPAFVYPTTHHGIIVRRVNNATLAELLRYCDFEDPTIRTYQLPRYAIYEDGQVHPYGVEQRDRQALADDEARLREIEARNTRYGAPTMKRTSSMQAHKGSHPNMRSLYSTEQLAAARKLREDEEKAEAAARATAASTRLDRQWSQQLLDEKDVKRASRSSSVASSQASQHKPQGRRASYAYSLGSLSSDSNKSPALSKQ